MSDKLIELYREVCEAEKELLAADEAVRALANRAAKAKRDLLNEVAAIAGDNDQTERPLGLFGSFFF